jgi:hypothetical protein
VKQDLKINLALISIALSIFFCVIFDEPIEAFGQSRAASLSQEVRRDPFLLPSGIRLLTAAELASGSKEKALRTEGKPVEPPPPLLALKAILISPQIRLAAVNRQIVGIGDSIYEEKVLEIERDRVVLGRKDGKRTLLLPQSPVRVKVEER